MPKKDPGSLSLQKTRIPSVSVHKVTEVPVATGSERWRYIDWDAVHAAIEDGEAVSLPVPPDEVHVVRLYAYKRFADEECVASIGTTYNRKTRRLWIWPTKALPALSEEQIPESW